MRGRRAVGGWWVVGCRVSCVGNCDSVLVVVVSYKLHVHVRPSKLQLLCTHMCAVSMLRVCICAPPFT